VLQSVTNRLKNSNTVVKEWSRQTFKNEQTTVH